jgi:hypothetical protein
MNAVDPGCAPANRRASQHIAPRSVQSEALATSISAIPPRNKYEDAIARGSDGDRWFNDAVGHMESHGRYLRDYHFVSYFSIRLTLRYTSYFVSERPSLEHRRTDRAEATPAPPFPSSYHHHLPIINRQPFVIASRTRASPNRLAQPHRLDPSTLSPRLWPRRLAALRLCMRIDHRLLLYLTRPIRSNFASLR